MKKINKTKSQIRSEKEKLVMENFASVMKKLDATFLIENEEEKVNCPECDGKGAVRFKGEMDLCPTCDGGKLVSKSFEQKYWASYGNDY